MRGFLITLLVLAAIGVGIDFAARWIIEDRVSAQVAQAQGLDSPPDISATGFPFLTQALRGEYPTVTYEVDDLSYGDLENIGVTADLTDVRVPFDELISGQVDAIPAEGVTAAVSLDPSELASVLRVDDVTVEPVTEDLLEERRASSEESRENLSGVDAAEAVQVISTQTFSGVTAEVSAIATVQISGGGRFSLEPRDVAVASDGIPDALRPTIDRAITSRLSGFSGRIDPSQLPFGLTVDGITARDGRLVVTGSAADVDLLDPDS